MNLLGILLVISGLLFSPCHDECKKVKNLKPVRPWMGVVLAKTFTVNGLQGRVVDSNEKSLSGAQLEIIKISGDGVGRIIYLCKTQGSGKFRFRNLDDGRYEIRVSLTGHDQTSVRVKLSKGSKSTESIVIPLKVSS